MKMRMLTSIAVVLVLGACSGSDEEPEAAEPKTSATAKPSEKPKADTAADDGCIVVSPEFASFLGEQIEPGTTIGKAAAYKSSDFEKVWMVAAVLEGGADGGKAVFATNADPTGVAIAQVFAVDGYAQEFSAWPDGGDTVPNGSGGQDEAKDCL